MLGRTNLAIGKTGDFPSSEFRVGPATKQHRHRAPSEQPLLRTASFQCWRRAARPWLCLRSVKCGNATTEVIWVDPVAETDLRTGAFVAKCERISPARINVQETGRVLAGLAFNAGQCIPFRFGLYGGDRFSTSE
jgi:hypothetical protein